MSDYRNYFAKISVVDSTKYMANDWKILIDSNFVQTNSFHVLLTLVENSERVLGGMYQF